MDPAGRKIGIIQGRLSPPCGGRIQAFPFETWREEFSLAREAGLAFIEWVLDDLSDENPVLHKDGQSEMASLIDSTGVSVWALCADCYMTERLIRSDGTIEERQVEHLIRVLHQASKVKIRHLVLPFVDSSSLKSAGEIECLNTLLSRLKSTVAQTGVEIHLETDLEASAVCEVLRHSGEEFRATYDMGNSAALGRDPNREIPLLSNRIGSVHVKDRLLNGETVPLGAGNVSFAACFERLREAGYGGIWTLQVARENGISELELAVRNRGFVAERLDRADSKSA